MRSVGLGFVEGVLGYEEGRVYDDRGLELGTCSCGMVRQGLCCMHGLRGLDCEKFCCTKYVRRQSPSQAPGHGSWSTIQTV